MSESLTVFDYIIFAMAPLGILTAVISAIRVCGGSSLRAFIGRSQEGMGAIEAELCSSTSRDVCELYKSGGGIARVMGRPKLLEIVHDPSAEEEEFFDAEDDDNQDKTERSGRKGSAGLYSAQDYLLRTKEYSKSDQWEEIVPKWGGLLGYKRKEKSMDQEKQPKSEDSSPEIFAPSPNLTLNIWMRKPPTWAPYAAAVFGIALQASVIAFAAIVTYYLKYKKEDSDVPAYGFPLMAVGTIALCMGIYLCAFLVGECTTERKFRRTDMTSKHFKKGLRPNFIWLQPGGQRVGDQTFDAFAYSDATALLREYTTSWKALNHTFDAFDSGDSFDTSPSTNRIPDKTRTVESGKHTALGAIVPRVSESITSADASASAKGTKEKTRRGTSRKLVLQAAMIFSVSGFIAQFVGLRTLHSSISIMQLGALLVMSFVRSVLRARRMDPSKNRLEGVTDYVQGHELDWLALDLAIRDVHREDKGCARSTNTETYLIYRPLWIHTPFNSLRNNQGTCRSDASVSECFAPLLHGDADWDKCRAGLRTAQGARVVVYGSTRSCHSPFQRELYGSRPSLPNRIFMLRKRLGHLTSGNPSQARPAGKMSPSLVALPLSMRNWSVEQVSLRDQVSSLSLAIRETADILFSSDTKFSGGWEKALSFQWVVGCSVIAQRYHSAPICLKIWRKSTTEPWECDRDAMESILGLYVWSLHADRRMERKVGAVETRCSSAASVLKHRIISFNGGSDGGLCRPDEKLWIRQKAEASIRNGTLSPGRATQDRSATQEYPVMTLSPWDLFRINSSKKSSEFLPLSYHHPSTAVDESAVVRFLGWNAAGRLSQRNSTHIRFVTTELPLAQMCAQEVFASFIRALFSVVDRIGGTSESTWTSLWEPELGNTEISKIIEVFAKSNLGSHRDAVFTTLPAIGSPRLRSLKVFAELSRKQAKDLRQKEDWEEAMSLCDLTMIRVKNLFNDGDGDGDGDDGHLRAMDALSTLWVTYLEIQRMHCNLKGDTAKRKFLRRLRRADPDHCRPLLQCYSEVVSKKAASNEATPDHNSPHLLTGNLQEDLLWLGHPSAKLSRDQLTKNLFVAATMEWDIPEASSAGRLKDEVSRVIIEMLLELGADPNHIHETSGRTPISYAAEKGLEQAVASLLEAGAIVNAWGKDDKSALHYASIQGHVDVVRTLLREENIDVHSKDMHGCTGLIYAAAHKHARVVELIANSGKADIGEELNCVVVRVRDLDSLNGSTREEVGRCILGCIYWRLPEGQEQAFFNAITDER